MRTSGLRSNLHCFIWTFCFAVGTVACGGGEDGPGELVDARDIEGTYTVDMHTVGSGCDGGEASTEYEYFKLIGTEFLGMQALQFEECPTLGECHSNFLETFSVIRQRWAQQIAVASYSDTTCNLGYTAGTLDIDLDTKTVTIELRRYSDEDASLTEDGCTAEVAEERGETMACNGYELLVGTLSE